MSKEQRARERGEPPGPNASEQEVVEHYAGFVNSIVQKVASGLAMRVERDDLTAYGQLGLIQAWRRYDWNAEAKFVTYAYYRVRGAIYDGCRKEGWISRGKQQAQLGAHEAINNFMEHHHQAEGAHSPEPKSLSESVERVSDLVGSALTILFVEGSDFESVEMSAPPRQDKVVERQDKNDKLAHAIKQLEPDEQILIKRHHYYGESLVDIGKDLNKSKSWCSRLHARAIERLRDVLSQDQEVLDMRPP